MDVLKAIECYKDSDKLAMVHNVETLSFKELWDYSDTLAGYLKETLGNNKDPIVVYGHKSPYMLVCFLACTKSGHAYCPIDETVPHIRVKAIIETVNPPVILATQELDVINNKLNMEAIKKIINSSSYHISENDYLLRKDVYYIIFTSGSTGEPKGVQITYEALNNFVTWALTLGKIPKENQVFINQAPFSFDLSVMDLYMSLTSESTLWSLDKNIQKDYQALFTNLEKSNASIWVSTPSFIDLCLTDKKFSSEMLSQMKLFLFCGEILTNKTATLLQQRFPDAEIYNTYGPTESTVAISGVKITKEILEKYNPLPVGQVKLGTWVKIVEDGVEVPTGSKGEIIIVGNTVSSGYFNNLENTKKAFFEMEIDGVTHKAYRTGDKGYMLDGQLFYNGRIDLQIKLHGYRMEIEDIEKNILKLEKIKAVVVIPNYEDNKVKSLSAYCIYEDEIISRLKTTQAIKEELKELIPNYMIPKKFIFVESMPTTNNGKVDRKALLELNK